LEDGGGKLNLRFSEKPVEERVRGIVDVTILLVGLLTE
jgi:hypothetical protein